MILGLHGGLSRLQGDHFRPQGFPPKNQDRSRNRQSEPPRAGTARVQEEHAISSELGRLVGMTAYDRTKTGRRRIQVKLLHIVKNIEQGSTDLHHLGLPKAPSPRPFIHISPHGHDRRTGAQLVQNPAVSYVAGVNDQISV